MLPVNPKFICWKCEAAFDVDQKFCGACGADMHHASPLALAARADEVAEEFRRAPRINRRSFNEDSSVIELRRRDSDDDPRIGTVIDNRYLILDVLGEGGMGIVYKVKHQRMGKIAALKMLHGDLAREPEVLQRFQLEAAAVSRLNHHNTVQVFDFGAYEGALYLVMEYVRGIDLSELIERDGPLSFEVGAPLFAQTCASLIEAHQLGVIHRDLKPENIVVTRTHRGEEMAKVLDFGLAKLSEHDDVDSSVTSRGSVVGTPYFMSPEQIRGDDVDQRSDIYSLGALMYKVITGEPPFDAKNPVGVLTKHLTDSPVPPSRHVKAIPPAVDDLILRCLEKKVEDRFSSAEALAEAIEDIYADLVGGETVKRRLYSGSVLRRESGDTRSGVTPIPRPQTEEDRLRRSDVDHYEVRIRRRKR